MKQRLPRFKKLFIGGPLDGDEQMTAVHEGINDQFWHYYHYTDRNQYRYRRLDLERYADSDYVLEEVRPITVFEHACLVACTRYRSR